MALIPLLHGCGGRDAETPVDIRRLDRILASGVVPQDSGMRDAAAALFMVSGYGALTDSSVAVYASMPSLTIHRHAVDSTFPTLRHEENVLGHMLGNLHSKLPKVGKTAVYAVISPFNQSVFTVDSILFIGLNHYLGTDYAPYGYFPDYMRRRKVRHRIPADVAEVLIRKNYPYTPQTEYPQAITRMLYEGAVVEAVMQVTAMEENEVLGYDIQETAWVDENERQIWNALASRRLLFSTRQGDVRSLVIPAASTPLVHTDAPGGIGRFIGHRIVRAYIRNNPDVTVECLLSPDFYMDTYALSRSGY